MHLHCYGASTFGRLAGLLTGVPAVVQDYDTEVYFPYPRYLWLADTLLARSTARAIAASAMVRRFQIERRKIPADRISMMFHAVPPGKFQPVAAERIRAVRARLGADERTPIVGTVTKLGPQRGNRNLVEVAARVLQRVPAALFMVVYKPTLYHRLPSKKYVEVTEAERGLQVAELVTKARALSIERSIRFVEWPDSLDEFVAACNLMVFPFLSERFSSVNLLESLAQGKPVIATDLGEQQEIVRDGANGYLVPPGDVEAMARTIVAALENPAELEAMGQRAREDALRYSVRGTARRLERLYARLAGRPVPEGDDEALPSKSLEYDIV
jgi:glycosyltransferase involved in cell wall biosynthesis